jgi:pimeloyl-ACP methyl ester carboxylesterase
MPGLLALFDPHSSDAIQQKGMTSQTKTGAVEGTGGTIRYLDWGGAGPPLILIHATGFLAALWRPIAEQLSNRFRVVAVDQRGHGDSDKPDDGYRFEAFAEDLQRVIEELSLQRPIVAGHSSGGTTIVAHAARHPGIIGRAVLIEPILPRPDWYVTPPGGRNNVSLAVGARKRRAVWDSRDEAYASYRQKKTFAGWRVDVLRLYVDEGMADREDGGVELKCPPEIEGKFFEAVSHTDPWPMIEKLTVPTLVLWGSASHLHARGLGDSLQAALPAARTVVVPNTTHFLPQERPDEVARLIDEFLAD